MKLRRKHRDKKGVHLIAHTHPKLPVSEQYRLIRTNIQFSSVDKELKSLIVTSPESSEGKSTTAANLAIVLAQQGKKVLLVDADLRKPTIHITFNTSNIDGLTNVLTKEISLLEAISNTYIPNLDILTSGPIPPNPSELLNSETMETLMRDMNQIFDYVVYDTPPVLAVTDPQILANKCDGVVMVVASGKTRIDQALKARELLEKAKSQLLGVVVNGVETGSSEYYS
ncbi:CpsD/CapB family tyrosine-protein kinase [Bacillus massilinigeriensis]|uniref:CpsD/CapB family tyrosine-protein kinase n=1 Tax=Bacillus massilionigeriensis TaxID=1805475 RepID=UPI00096B10B9|nr:CpsD/CapB family tyrosine-protein kinase [Bacillus massilionigeriensis]